jgi:NAD-dependent deacetylase
MHDAAIALAAQWIHDSKQVVILTGAGVSKESGIDTYRDGEDSTWSKFNPMEVATHRALQENPQKVWEFTMARLKEMTPAKPNPGHFGLADLQKYKGNVPIITQNIDDLHEQAGSRDVIHLHGRLNRFKCKADCQGKPTLLDLASLSDDKNQPPLCPHCGDIVRPDIVLFGEILPEAELNRAEELSLTCDLMLVIGTSGLVSPADSLPKKAKRNSATIIEINPAYSMITRIADLKIEAPSGIIMPAIIKALDILS